MYRGELLLFLLVVGIFSIDFFKARTSPFFDFSTLPPKITQWELDSCTRTISVQAVTGGIPPYDFYVFKQDAIDSSSWEIYRLIKEQLPQILGLPTGNYRIKAVNEGVSSPNSSTNILAVSFPSDPEIEIKGPTSLCSGGSPAIALRLINTEVSLPILWTARVLLPPEDGEVLGYSANPTVSRLGIFDTLINTGTTIAKVEYQIRPVFGRCMLPTRLVEVLVDPLPRVEANASQQVVCSGIPFSISLQPKSWGSSPMQLRWTAEVLSGEVVGLAESGQAPLNGLSPITQTLANQGTSIARVRYTFSPQFQDCVGIPESIEIEVLPELTLVPLPDLVFCSGDAVTIPEFTTNLSDASIVYSWEVDGPSIGFASTNGYGSQIPSFVAINTGTSPKQTRITVTPKIEDLANGISCPGMPSSFLVTVRAPLQIQEQLSNYGGYGVSCADSFDGKILLEVTGGMLPSEGTGYSFFWTGPENFVSTAPSLNGLQAVVYRVQVSIGGSCMMEKSMELTQPDALQITQSKQDNLCFQGRSGSLLVNASGGVPPYSYAWTGPNNFSATVANPQNLMSGSYQLRVSDANGCTITGAPQTITEPAALALTQTKTDNSCFQGNAGSLSIIATGGTASYSYAWTGPNNFSATVANPQNLMSGNYQVRVSDANGCTITGALQTIAEPAGLALTQTKTNNRCFQGTSGSLLVIASGGVPPYSYVWTGPNGFTSTNQNPQDLVSGTYQVTVTDANGCVALGAPQTITEPAPLTLIAQIQVETCTDAKNGRLEVMPSGGIPPYQVSWDNGATGQVVTGLGAGTYRVTVTDQGGCIQTAEYVLLPIPALRLEGTVTYQATQVPLQISARLQSGAQGGTPPYTYRWSTGQTLPGISVTESGTYTLQLRDAKDCIQEKEFAVDLPLPLAIELNDTTVPLCEEQGQETTLRLSIRDGLAPYQITWSRGTVSEGGLKLTTRESGVFAVEVKDALGFIEKRILTIPPRLTGPIAFTYLFASQAEFAADLAGFEGLFRPLATWPFQVTSWDFGDGTSSSEVSPTHTYTTKGRYLVTLTVVDKAGCLIKQSKELDILDYFIEIPNVFTPNADALNDTFFPKFRFVRNLQLQVVNKWGELIYRSKGPKDPGWNGLVSGEKASEGTYVYTLRYQVPDGRIVTSSSTFLLAR